MYYIAPMAAEIKASSNSGDWRGSFCTSLFQMADLVNSSPGLNQISTNPLTLPESFSESLRLSSTQRLFGLNQVSTVAQKVLGFEVTRGQHTEDTMRLTAGFLTQTPELLNQLTTDYNLTPEEAIKHCVEYMRLHDLATLAFQGAMHGRVKVGEDNYDEDHALLMAFETIPVYQPVSDLLFDAETIAFYEKAGINKNILHQTAEDSINGTTLLGRMLKKGGDCPPIDWLAYTARDFYELARIFGIDSDTPFPQKIEQVLNGLQGVSQALAEGTPFALPEKFPETKNIEQLIPQNMVRLEEIDNEPKLIYDGKTIAELYTMHTILRLFLSGSPWIRGTHRLIHETFRNSYNDDTDLLKRLLSASEKELLETDLKDALPMDELDFHIRGWGYLTSPADAKPESFVFKGIGQTLVDFEGRISPFKQTFPDLMKLTEKVKNQPPLYLKHSL